MQAVLHQTETCRYERIGSQVTKLELNYIDKETEHPIFMKAREFYLNQKWNNAKREYKKLLSINPKNSSYHNSYACILSRFQGQDATKTLRTAQKHSCIATKLDPTLVEFRLTNAGFLVDLQSNDEAHKQFEIIFDQLFSTNHDRYHHITLNPHLIATAFEIYARFLFHLCENQDAAKYIEKSIAICKKFGLEITPRVQHDLALNYVKMDKLNTALHHISTMKLLYASVSDYDKFHCSRTNNVEPWSGCEAEIYLLTESYEAAYTLLKYEMETLKRDNAMFSNLIRYIQLMECCIELKKFSEAVSLDDELYAMYSANPSILDQARNRNVHWEREFLVSFLWIKKGGMDNAMRAVKHIQYTTHEIMELNMEMGNRMPCAHFYLGMAYKNLSQYTKCVSYKEDCISKAKEALFQAVHSIPSRTKVLWQFALIMFEGNTWYLCKKYAKKAWKRCKDIKSITKAYPAMKKKWKKEIKQLKCGCCGKHKYLNSRKRCDQLRVCKGCYAAYYCNRNCQKLHWKKSHRKQCSKIWIEYNKKLFITIEDFNQFIPFTHLTDKYCLIESVL